MNKDDRDQTAQMCCTSWALVVHISIRQVSYEAAHLRRIMRKPAFCICENKDAGQLGGNCEADQRLCFRYIDSTF